MRFTDENGVVWERRGYCSGCGECCLWDDPSFRNPLFSDADRESRQVADKCPLLRLLDGHYRCAGHGWHPFYLNGCNTFPARPEDMRLVPSCTFEWVAI